jgi:hypothetical protein
MFLLTGCATKYSYNKNVDFSRLETFKWHSLTADSDIDESTKEFVSNEINQKLLGKGLTLASETPDFLISGYIGKKIKFKATDFGATLTKKQIEQIQYVEGSLVLIFSDANSKELIWWGSVQAKFNKNFSREKKEEIARKAIDKILSKYPPIP